jgi:hypothetical protein
MRDEITRTINGSIDSCLDDIISPTMKVGALNFGGSHLFACRFEGGLIFRPVQLGLDFQA